MTNKLSFIAAAVVALVLFFASAAPVMAQSAIPKEEPTKFELLADVITCKEMLKSFMKNGDVETGRALYNCDDAIIGHIDNCKHKIPVASYACDDDLLAHMYEYNRTRIGG